MTTDCFKTATEQVDALLADPKTQSRIAEVLADWLRRRTLVVQEAAHLLASPLHAEDEENGITREALADAAREEVAQLAPWRDDAVDDRPFAAIADVVDRAMLAWWHQVHAARPHPLPPWARQEVGA